MNFYSPLSVGRVRLFGREVGSEIVIFTPSKKPRRISHSALRHVRLNPLQSCRIFVGAICSVLTRVRLSQIFPAVVGSNSIFVVRILWPPPGHVEPRKAVSKVRLPIKSHVDIAISLDTSCDLSRRSMRRWNSAAQKSILGIIGQSGSNSICGHRLHIVYSIASPSMAQAA